MADPSPLNWSASFAILPTTNAPTKALRGDKILLPPSALENLLAASTSWTNGFGNFGQPPRDNFHQLPNPLMFRLVNPMNNNVVYAGIREFSAPEGTIGLSPYLADSLGLKEEDLKQQPEPSREDTMEVDDEASNAPTPLTITVHARQLPKGSFVRLRPLEAGYNPADWKALLERQLRDSFTTLTRDSVLAVQGVQGESFRFLVDKIAPEGDGICVVDTDLEVDIEALNEDQARETMRQIMSGSQPEVSDGSSKGGELDIWKPVSGQVVPGEYVDYILPSWNRSQALNITLSGIQDPDSLDLFINPKSPQHRALPRDSTHVFGHMLPATDGVKSISIAPSNVELDDAEAIQVSIYAYHYATEDSRVPITFTLRAQMETTSHGSQAESSGDDQTGHSPDDEQCKNCLQWVPKRTIVLHENFCRRNNIICPQCQAVFKKDSEEWHRHWHCDRDEGFGNSERSKDKHEDIFHNQRECPGCEFSSNSLSDLARHRTSVCPGKIILCRFCHLEVPQEGDPFNPAPEVVLSGMTAHELADGARTTECHLCDKIVRLRDMETHLKHHELDKVSRPKPLICRNANCGRTQHGVGPKGQIGSGNGQKSGPSNDLGLCSLCFGPLYVSMHDPEGKALRRRIERRYLGQLMTGCGKPHCRNEWCKTGRANQELEPKGSNASAALPLVKPLLEMAKGPSEPMFFCVDEASQLRRKMAEMVAAEKAWDLEWCIAAAEAGKGDATQIREWLQAWAPRR
ncbi:unnamed protein product [Clonostachys byssicola]|uniref:Ubiquitin-protein ligase E3A N-terminal zinc-binding domain-containing protein n=1 Tax=Clonostachys byssicola TaxID=160290 RepID=A0A9N9U8Y5_9HYPO|nr:unnamed protein product [Clonostachys byssicola]